jgi:hypothetical protein
LAYSDKKHDDFDIEPAVEFSVSELVLWGGDHGDDRIFITLPLKCPGRQKHSVLEQQAKVFEKIAKNPRQDFLTPSFERRKQAR